MLPEFNLLPLSSNAIQLYFDGFKTVRVCNVFEKRVR